MRVLVPGQILSSGWKLFWTHRRAWFDCAIIPLIWLIAVALFLLPSSPEPISLDPNDPASRDTAMELLTRLILLMAALIVIGAMFSTAWMRFCLGLGAAAAPAGLSFDPTVRAVTASLVKLTLVHIAATLVVLTVAGADTRTIASSFELRILALLASAPLLIRLSMMLPAAASGGSSKIGAAWQMTRGNWFSLLLTVGSASLTAALASVLLTQIIQALVRGIFGALLTIGPRMILLLINGSILFAGAAFVLSVIVVCYRQLSGPSLQVVPEQRDSA